ncbi:MAG: DUF1638 domain-containing protein [Ignavibacteriales bacterium]|nr:DUF1638 domain-containing protein [Ignavibacteriales bacterium]
MNENKLCIIVCDYFTSEIAYLLDSGEYSDIALNSFASNCHLTPSHQERINKVVAAGESQFDKVVFIGCACHLLLEERKSDANNIEIIPLNHSLELFLSNTLLEHLFSEKYYIVSNGWLRNYTRHIKDWGFDSNTAKKFFKESADKILFLDTGLPDSYMPKLETMSEFTGLPFEILPIGLSYCKQFIDSIVTNWRQDKERKYVNAKLAQSSSRVAEYALTFTEISNLVDLIDEKEIIDKISNLITVLFAPEKIVYIPQTTGQDTDSQLLKPAEILNAAVAQDSFFIEMQNHGDQIGRIEVIGITFPRYIEKYKEISSIIGRVGGLALSNAKKFSIISKNENRLKEYANELKHINDSKDKLFSIIAHDLRSPLHGLLGLTALMSAGEKFSAEELPKIGAHLHKAVSNLNSLMENLLEWAQIQKGALNINPRVVNVSSILERNIAFFQQRGAQKGIIISNNIPGNLEIYADEDMTNTIIRNLLSNAIKFTNRGGRIAGEAKLTDSCFVEISIADTGVGITDNIVQKLFKIGEKVSSLGTENEASTGLGLIICMEFVEMHGGKIWVESKEGSGSTFFFTLPACKIN